MSALQTPEGRERHRALEQSYRSRRELRMFVRRLMFLLVAVVALIAMGTIAFTITDGKSVGLAFLWTLDTVTTQGAIGIPPSTGGRVVVVLLEVFGIGTLF